MKGDAGLRLVFIVLVCLWCGVCMLPNVYFVSVEGPHRALANVVAIAVIALIAGLGCWLIWHIEWLEKYL